MHILYLDDSGSIKNTNEKYFVLGGVSVPESSLHWLNGELEKLAGQLFPAAPRQVEFHATEIYGGRVHPWDMILKNRDAKVQTIKQVLQVLDNAYREVAVFACAIHKDSFPNEDPVSKAFEQISGRFDIYLNRISVGNARAKGLIVLDKSSYETSLQDLAHQFRSQGNRWGNMLHNISEVPLFVDSKASRIIQLADHIAYAVFRRYNADDLSYFRCIESRFDQEGDVLHGLVHLQTYNPNCTCPACITRRIRKSS